MGVWQSSLEDVEVNSAKMESERWRGKRVFVTGHTGFKGGWLVAWLVTLGAKVKGYALAPDTRPSLFDSLRLENELDHVLGDIRDRDRLERELIGFAPEVVFHLAAQPLVRSSYEIPVETYTTNVLGTVHLMDAIRRCDSVRAVVNVTSDKCYENREWSWGYRETDALGGYDPYSSSKAASELATSSWRRSFFHPDRYDEHGVGIASARAGNVVGGGDWSLDRLIPDAARAFGAGRTAQVRNPAARRPWQHVMEPLFGYLLLAEQLQKGPDAGEAWNFGPNPADVVAVREVMDGFSAAWGHGAAWQEATQPDAPHEAGLLVLDCGKAHDRLGWRPRMDLGDCLRVTADWYKAHGAATTNTHLLDMTRQQIDWYTNLSCVS